jgi:hypothetical protein
VYYASAKVHAAVHVLAAKMKKPVKGMLGVKHTLHPSKKVPPWAARQAALKKILPRHPIQRREKRQVGTKEPMQDPHLTNL